MNRSSCRVPFKTTRSIVFLLLRGLLRAIRLPTVFFGPNRQACSFDLAPGPKAAISQAVSLENSAVWNSRMEGSVLFE